MAGHVALRRVVAPGGTGGAIYAGNPAWAQALVSGTPSAVITEAQWQTGFNTFYGSVDVDSYVALGASASVTTGALYKAGETFEIQALKVGDQIVIQDA